jgi:hypothetical protein
MGDYEIIRDARGRFPPGVRQPNPRPGRSPRSEEDRIVGFLSEILDDEDLMTRARTTLRDKLESADLKTWQFVISYLVGLPVQRVKLQSESTVLAGILGDLRNRDDATTHPETLADSGRTSEDS